MIRTIRARYCDGKLEPLEALDLDEGEEVVLSIGERPVNRPRSKMMQSGRSCPREFGHPARTPRRPSDELMAADKAWRENHDYEAFKRMIYLARIEGSRERPHL